MVVLLPLPCRSWKGTKLNWKRTELNLAARIYTSRKAFLCGHCDEDCTFAGSSAEPSTCLEKFPPSLWNSWKIILSRGFSRNTYVPRLTPMFRSGVFNPIAATSVQNNTDLGLGMIEWWYWCWTKLEKSHLVRKFDIAFSFPEWDELPVTNSTFTSSIPAFMRHSFSHVPDNSTYMHIYFLNEVPLEQTHMFSKSNLLWDKTPDTEMSCWRLIPQDVEMPSILYLNFSPRGCQLDEETQVSVTKPVFLMIKFNVYQRKSNETSNFNDCIRKKPCIKGADTPDLLKHVGSPRILVVGCDLLPWDTKCPLIEFIVIFSDKFLEGNSSPHTLSSDSSLIDALHSRNLQWELRSLYDGVTGIALGFHSGKMSHFSSETLG